MKIYIPILLLSILSFAKSDGSVATIETAITKTSVAKDDEFTVKIKNNENAKIDTGGTVTGLSFVSGANTIALTCNALAADLAAAASVEVKCKAAAAQTNKGEYTLTAANDAKVGANSVLTVDAGSKKLTIGEESKSGGDNGSGSGSGSGDGGNDDDISKYQKVSYILFSLFAFLF